MRLARANIKNLTHCKNMTLHDYCESFSDLSFNIQPQLEPQLEPSSVHTWYASRLKI